MRIVFNLPDEPRFRSLNALCSAIAQAKLSGDFRDDPYWESFLDERSREHFWWPTDAELSEWRARWLRTPVERRHTEPALATAWVFGSLIDAARNGEFEQLSCRRTAGGGVIELVPVAWPFGGTDWVLAMIRAFGGSVDEPEAGQ